MHPAGSVIVFTVASGLGFGLLTWLGIGVPTLKGWHAFWYYAVAFGLAGGGLLASTFHLGNPQRFLKAFSQWRSSWLSREGCLAVASMAVMGVFAICSIFMGSIWQPLGYIGAALSVLTIFATSMIYAQLKTVPRWNHWTTPCLFLLLSLGGGALLALQTWSAGILIGLAGVVQLLAWYLGDNQFKRRRSNIGTATGLGFRGTVRSFESPHTGNNYLLKEMVHKVGRKHAQKLRVIAFALMIVSPLICLFISFSIPVVAVALVLHILGIFTQRWLFFAEAEHVVGLYYGKR